MIEIDGDIFDFVADPTVNAVCVFTNAIVNSRGLAMAGAGQAGEAARRFANFRLELGAHLVANGNVVGIVGYVADNVLGDSLPGTALVAFPTKSHFANASVKDLIVQSAVQLRQLANELGWTKVVLGCPGCGAATGRLDWNEVRQLVQGFWDERFVVVNKVGS